MSVWNRLLVSQKEQETRDPKKYCSINGFENKSIKIVSHILKGFYKKQEKQCKK